MRTETALTPTLLKDYRAPEFDIQTVYMDVKLDPAKTRITSTLQIKRVGTANAKLNLDGEDINLVSVSVDGNELKRSAYKLTQSQLILSDLPEAFTLELVTTCAPKDNTRLMGLYVSGGRFCTQCEAEGFRRITYFLDRPDVLSKYTVRMEADKDAYPTLLANGNMIESGDMAGRHHFAVWEDPFPKPSYLFAMVAGKFDRIDDNFTTMSGRDIPLEIYVDPGDSSRAHYAMDSLKRSMKWDEEAFGREYDLNRFMIVAVRDFNFGAMENKGLNIFNSALLLADAESATDMNFQRIESVVAHEYFHNWTGNRITCRDWFQLCLKEGFTVFRDQEFSAHERGAPLQRIKDVRALRARQFPEDAGPLAHPVRPEAYMKIDNFYTATIYEKGAELIRMLKTLLGEDGFRKGADLYFETLDGTAATVEQFVSCFQEVTGKDLTHFARWYSQAGTPQLSVKTEYNASDKTYTISMEQRTLPTPGQPKKEPMVLPLSLALIGQDGQIFGEQVFEMRTQTATIKAENISTKPALSILRNFSAPVRMIYTRPAEDAVLQMAHDTDLFNRWEAGQGLARELMVSLTNAIQSGNIPPVDPALRGYVSALRTTLRDPNIDPGFKALALSLPSLGEVLQQMKNADPIAIAESSGLIKRAIADGCQAELEAEYQSMQTRAAFSPDATSAGRRALKNACLSLLATQGRFDTKVLARKQFETATNMTDELSALMTLLRMAGPEGEEASDAFYEKWKSNALVVDKWFALRSTDDRPQSLSRIASLLDHAAYQANNPNRVRALVGGLAMSNAKTFHAANGSGYQFFTDRVLDMDSRNPGVAARLLGMMEIWPRLDEERQTLIKKQLRRVIASKPSKNVLEIATKALGA